MNIAQGGLEDKKTLNFFYSICHNGTVSLEESCLNVPRKQPLPAPDLSKDICYSSNNSLGNSELNFC